MTDLQTLKAIENLLDKFGKFESLTSSQQAAFRSQLTKLEKKVDDPGLSQVLGQIREIVGESEAKPSKSLTADDLVIAYKTDYKGLNARQRTAFKANVSRVLNKAKEIGDDETVLKLEALQATMEEDTVKFHRSYIDKMAKRLLKADEPKEEGK